VGAQPAFSQHTLVLEPSFVFWHRDIFQNHGWEQDLDECPAFGRGPWPVGYQHHVATFWFGDSYENCVFETAVSFDLSGLHQYPGAVITQARLSYTDGVDELLDGDGWPTGDPHDVQQDAVFGSCAAQLGTPNDDGWRGPGGLIPHTLGDDVKRLDRTTWDVTNHAQRWYSGLEDQNSGLVLVGYDEGTDFSNNAACISGLDNFKLAVDFVSNDPTPTPTPTFLQRVETGGNAASGALPTAAPTLPPFHRSEVAPLLGTPTPTPVGSGAVSRVLPDFVISGVETNGYPNTRGLEPTFSAGQPITFTIHVKNIGPLATVEPAVVALSVDGVPKATTTVDALAPGAKKTATIGGIVLGAGTHGYVVTVNEGRKIQEADFSNDAFTFYPLLCY
jgi:uncharacterized repeat protein (TIGR01451 family)